jgi:lipoprotein-anchoring transpeptidase ErfK/SrfK
MKKSERRRRLLALVLSALLGVLAVFMVEANVQASGLESGYQFSLHQLNSEMSQATTQGYTPEDLAPVATRLATIQAAPEPVWVGERPGYYQHQGNAVAALRTDLRQLEGTVTEETKSKVATALAGASAKIAEDRKLEVDAADLQQLQVRFEQLTQGGAAATKLTDYRSVIVEAGKLDQAAAALGQVQVAENEAIRKGAEEIKARTGGNLDAIRKAALKTLADARDDATIEGFLDLRKTFTGSDSVMKPLAKLEKYAGWLGDGDPERVAFGASALARYGGQVHEAAMKGMPAKTIVIYIQDQYLIAYDHGQQAMGTSVTTGRPSLPTDVGPMKIIYRQSPFVMRSPWPKQSPFWYPDSPVRKVMWFTETGEGLHDATWRSWFGAGSNLGDGTHGCVNLPGDRVDWVWDWAPDGTPVIVIPGTGEPQHVQLAQNSIDTPAGQVIKGA